MGSQDEGGELGMRCNVYVQDAGVVVAAEVTVNFWGGRRQHKIIGVSVVYVGSYGWRECNRVSSQAQE